MAYEANLKATAPKNMGALENCIDRIERATTDIHGRTQVCEGIGDRLFGTRPTAVTKDAGAEGPGSEIGRLERAASNLERAAAYLQSEIERLGQI